MGYQVNDKRGEQKEPEPYCAVCGSPKEHTGIVDNPTMGCIEFLKGMIGKMVSTNDELELKLKESEKS